VYPETSRLEFDDSHADIGGDVAKTEGLWLFEKPYSPLFYLTTDGSSLGEGT